MSVEVGSVGSKAVLRQGTLYRPASEVSAEAEASKPQPLNIMCDPRVRRGRTPGVPSRAVPDNNFRSQKSPPARIRKSARQPWQVTVAEIHDSIQLAPRPRQEVPVQDYLEERPERTVTVDANSQTDTLRPLPPAAPYVPAKRGLDAGSQVDTKEVFSFDVDVEPLLEVLVSKTLDQATMEVSEETALSEARSHLERLERNLAAELAAQRAIVEAERARHAAKVELVEDARRRAELRRATESRLAAIEFSRRYLEGIQERVLERLELSGHFFDPVQREVEGYLEELAGRTADGVARFRAARALADQLLAAATARLAQEAQDEIRAKEERMQAEIERRRRTMVQLYIHCPVFGQRPVGPLRLSALATIRDVESNVVDWIRQNLKRPGRLFNMSFSLANGRVLAPDSTLYDIGLQNLSGLNMHVEREEDPAAPDDEEGDAEEDADAE